MIAAERRELVSIGTGGIPMEGMLVLPANALGMVLFAHGSGSSRHSPRNNFVAAELHKAALGTLLLDLLSPAEDLDRANRFDIDLLSERLTAAADWLAEYAATRALPLGVFGASTGAAAALVLAATRPVEAVVSRGGRPDLAGAGALAAVSAPTLLLVGALDTDVISLNRWAQAQLQCSSRLDIIPGASHLFEEPGRLPIVAQHALDWFAFYLPKRLPPPSAHPSSPAAGPASD
ncbi:MAG: alpha/beta family hydrolase [Pseudomonadota bacterium]